MKRKTKVSRPTAHYHYSRHCLWLAGIGDDCKVALQGEVMGKWEFFMDVDEMGSQSSYRMGEVTGTSYFKFQVGDLLEIVKFCKCVFMIEGLGSMSNLFGDLKMAYDRFDFKWKIVKIQTGYDRQKCELVKYPEDLYL
ncbi:hypothetical protein GIB67_017987 [Kingdonia uniflora]|uniref:Uncharacterized protein n=1 Tax=Kingdonia uniflora TaxID=39325 RepID=A0A7J7NWJ4_9MAGN|nr:hypothetical protein GIB67_017987 [Kingdonia uniflora]